MGTRKKEKKKERKKSILDNKYLEKEVTKGGVSENDEK